LTDAGAHQAQIDALWNFDDPIASEGRFRAAADAADLTDRPILLTQLARALGLQGRYDEAARLLDLQVEEVLVLSTGVIGVSLDAQVVSRGIIAAS